MDKETKIIRQTYRNKSKCKCALREIVSSDITVHSNHITCAHPCMWSLRCSVTNRIKATFLPLTQAWVSATFGPTPGTEKLYPLYTLVVRQASIASPWVTRGKRWELCLYRSIFTVWRRRKKNNTTEFFLWQGRWFLEMTPYKAEHDYSAVSAEIPSQNINWTVDNLWSH